MARPVRQLEHVAPRVRIVALDGDWRAEGHERAGFVAHAVSDHLRQLAAEASLRALDLLPGQDEILDHDVVRHGARDHHQVRACRLERRVDQACLRRLQLTAVAASALDVQHQVVTVQQLGDVRLQRDQVDRVFRVPPDGQRTGHVAVEQAQRTAEQVDAGGHDRRSNPVLVERQRFDQVIDVAAMVGRVQHPARGRGLLRDLDPFGEPFDLAENRVERVLQRPVDRVALGRPQLLQVPADAIPHLKPGLAMAAVQVADDVVAREHRLGEVVEHLVGRHYITRFS